MIWRFLRRRPAPAGVQWAALYRRGDVLFVAPKSRNVDGFYEEMPPYSRVGVLDGREALGAVIVAALAASKDGVENPWRDPAYRASRRGIRWWPLAEIAGVKSHKAFMQGTRYTTVKCEADVITFEPWRNDGKGFVPLQDQLVFQADAADHAHVGAQALAALDHAE